MLLERDGHLAHLVLNRPEVLNAIDNDDWPRTCRRCATRWRRRSRCGLVIFRGAGERAFCAGADLKARRDMTPERVERAARAAPQHVQKLRGIQQPMIAAVHGYALGGGTELAMLADFIIASDDAVFGLTEVSAWALFRAGAGRRTCRA